MRDGAARDGAPEAAPMAAIRGFPTSAGPLDLAVRRGDVVRLRGPNGSGKTSLLRQLAGLDAPLRAQAVHVSGADPRTMGAPALARALRAAWGTPAATLVGLTVAGEARLRRTVVPPAVAALADRPVARLSQGQAAGVVLAFLQASPAPLLLLDEASASLDGRGVATLRSIVSEAARRGAVVFADHSAALADLATREVVLADEPAIPGPAAAHVPPSDAGARSRLKASPIEVPAAGGPLQLPAIDVGPGFHAVTGRNGAGKTTLLRRLAGLGHTEGVTLDGAPPLPGRTTRLLQEDAGALATAQTVRDELQGGDPFGFVPRALLHRHPLSLSAGEAQRVALAKALRPARVHLLDEPDAHLDGAARHLLVQAIASRVRAGAVVVAATHDHGLAQAAASRIEVGA